MHMTNANTLSEIMARYNESRTAWIKKKGGNFNEDEFHEWFTKQVYGEQKSNALRAKHNDSGNGEPAKSKSARSDALTG